MFPVMPPSSLSGCRPVIGVVAAPSSIAGNAVDTACGQPFSSDGTASSHTEIARTVAAMPTAQLQICLGAMQRLAQECPESARAMLQENPQLCYALLHAQLLLGLTIDPLVPPDEQEIKELQAQATRRRAPVMATGVGLSPGLVTRTSFGLPSMLSGGVPQNTTGSSGLAGFLRPSLPGLVGLPPTPVRSSAAGAGFPSAGSVGSHMLPTNLSGLAAKAVPPSMGHQSMLGSM
jgi:hypothetical protein|eukprot:TRINITY_DN57090_c0_g1_i1.p1 TRINITY_DN57090_c0_g1~~TRINITY_DN57090_c0_g1_i1.p1  ORF type:complete len:233 (-),score=24.66 TRINITY_DN57090_c0_g1_i1:137-835(-)